MIPNSVPNISPLFNVPDKEKDENWYKQCVEAITTRSLNQTYTLNYTMMNESVNFFQGINSGDEFRFLQESHDGEALPAKWMNVNRIMSKLKIVAGEFMERGYRIMVRGLNKEVTSRKLEEKNRLLTEMRLRPIAQGLEQESGLPFTTDEYVPQDMDELDDFMETTWKDKAEWVMESALKWLSRVFDWDAERSYLFRDILIMGRCFVKVELCNDLPKIRRIDPRLMIFDTNATNDLLSDATYWGEVHYMGIAQAAEKYNLSKEEIDQVYATGRTNEAVSSLTNIMPELPTTKDNNILYYKNDGGELRVLVVTAYWADTKPYNHKESTDKYGGTHIQRANDDYKGKDGIKKRVKIWRKGTLIGGRILREWGEMENMTRDIESLSETCPPYIGLIPFYLNGYGISLTQQLQSLQNLKNIFAYQIQLAVSRAGTKSIVYDLSQLPEGWDETTMMKWMKTVGIIFINSKVDGIGAQFNQFTEIDLTISNTIEQYIKLMAWVDSEMNSVSGINEAREGISQGASQAVGVTQAALFQSNLSTAPLFKLFRSFSSKALGYQAKLVKLAWANKEKFAPIIGDTGVDFLNEDIELDLNDYGVFVEEIPMIVDDLQTYQNFITAAVQAGSLDFVEALKLMMETDVRIGIKRYEKAVKRKEREIMAQQEQQMQAESDAQMAMEQQKIAAERDKLAAEGSQSIQEILTKGKIDLTGKKIDALVGSRGAKK